MKQISTSPTVNGSDTTPKGSGEAPPPERLRLTIELLEDRTSPQVLWGDIPVRF